MPVHGALAPHTQLPMDEQPSPRPPARQSVHARPLVPHVVAVRVMHVLPSQHRDGHEVALQTQEPLMQA